MAEGDLTGKARLQGRFVACRSRTFYNGTAANLKKRRYSGIGTPWEQSLAFGTVPAHSRAVTSLLPDSFPSWGRPPLPASNSKGEDGIWEMFVPTKAKTQTGDLGNNGSVTYGPLGQSLLLHLKKPDTVLLEKLYRDTTLQMDLMLRGIPLYRGIGVEKIKITSLGKAQQDVLLTDHYERRWAMRTWNLPHNDQVVLLVSLPVPDGFIGMARVVPTGQLGDHIIDLKTLTDFVYLSYAGTLAQWREFLQIQDLLPPVFATLTIDFEYGKRFQYASKRLALSYGPEQMKITPRSDLRLSFSYFRENDKVVWDVGTIAIGEDKDSATAFTINRKLHPPRALDDSYRSTWQNITERRHPYNKSAYLDDKRTIIGDVYTGEAKAGAAKCHAVSLYRVLRNGGQR